MIEPIQLSYAFANTLILKTPFRLGTIQAISFITPFTKVLNSEAEKLKLPYPRPIWHYVEPLPHGRLLPQGSFMFLTMRQNNPAPGI